MKPTEDDSEIEKLESQFPTASGFAFATAR